MAGVTFERVTKRYGEDIAVNNLNIEVANREFLVLVGPSGCGKTTSLRMLAGLEAVTEGTILIGDRPVNDLPSKDRDIAMVFQSYALYPHMSVYDNMAFSLELRGMQKGDIRVRVEQAAKKMGILELLNRKPKELSGGQRQRVAVCRAIVRDPAVFLMDEPLSNLDAKLRVQARAEISKLHRELGTTFIYVTHDQVEAMTMGTRIAVMNHGVLQQIDNPENLYNLPTNLFVAGFIGSPAMNFFDATVIGDAEQMIVKTETFQIPVSPERAAVYAPYQGQAVVLGIRPEDIHDPDYIVPGVTRTSVKAKVSVIEQMGNEVMLHLLTPDNQGFVARVDRRSSLYVEEWVDIVFDADNIHLFDQQTEQRIG